MSRITGYARSLSLGVPFNAFSRDIWLICISNAIGALGEGMYFWVFPLYIKSLQADYVQLGAVFSALYGASALVLIPGGLLADRFDRKKILILSWIPWGLSPLIYSFAQSWQQLIPGAICWGISMLGLPAVNAYIISSVTDKGKLASVLSFVWSSYSFSYIFAPTIGAFLAEITGIRWVLRLSALLCGVATGVFLFLHSQNPRKDNKMSREIKMSSDKERRLWRQVLTWAGFFTATTFFLTVGRTFVQTFLSENIGLSEFHIGLYGSIGYAGTTFIGIAVGRLGDKWRKTGAFSLCLVFHFLSIAPLLLIREPTVLMTSAFLFGGAIVTGSLVSSFVGTVAPENKRGLWVSVPQTLSLLASFAAPFLGGYLYSQSPTYAFAFSIMPVPFLILFALAALKE